MPPERPPRGRTHPVSSSSRARGGSTGEYRRVRSTGEHSAVSDLPPQATHSGSHERPRGLRSSWPLAVVATVAVTTALIFVAWAKMQTVQYTYRIDELIDEEEELANRQRALRSEVAALRSPAALHALAPELGLAPPEPGHVVVVTRDPEGLSAALAEDDGEEASVAPAEASP